MERDGGPERVVMILFPLQNTRLFQLVKNAWMYVNDAKKSESTNEANDEDKNIPIVFIQETHHRSGIVRDKMLSPYSCPDTHRHDILENLMPPSNHAQREREKGVSSWLPGTQQEQQKRRSSWWPSTLAGLEGLNAKVTNFSIQYNLASASVAIMIMTSHGDRKVDDEAEADFPEPLWAKDSLLAAIFAGTFLGMLIMGYLGDLIGRSPAMIITQCISLLSILTSTFATWGGSLYAVFTVSRFFLGFGVGGMYPLSASQSAEAGDHGNGKQPSHDSSNANILGGQENVKDISERVGWAFFWQTPGTIAPYAVAIVLFYLTTDTSLQYRVLLGAGAVPCAIILWLSLEIMRRERMLENLESVVEAGDGRRCNGQHRGGGNIDVQGRSGTPPRRLDNDEPPPLRVGVVHAGGARSSASSLSLIHERVSSSQRVLLNSQELTAQEKAFYLYKLIGTGGSWFLFDVSYYGTAIFAPFILEEIIPGATLKMICWQSIFSTSIGIFGCIGSIYHICAHGCRKANTHGFVLMGASFGLLALSVY